jgi:membrane fusion protein (multidrug efflux system)
LAVLERWRVNDMVLIRRKRLAVFVLAAVFILSAGGYFAYRTFRGGPAGAADTTVTVTGAADTAKVAPADNGGKAAKQKKKGEKDKKEPEPVPVEIATVMPREISSYYYTTATLEAERKVVVLAKIAGQVAELKVEEGATVSDEELLCRIEDTEPKLALEEARINLEKQERERARIKKMFEERLISDREYSDATYQYDVAKNQYDAALARYEYTRVKAPFRGIVTERFVEAGQNLAVGAQLFEIADTEPLLVRMYLPENELKDVNVGQQVTIEPDNAPGTTLTGRVVRIAPEVDERTGTVKVTAETDGGAMPGSFARVRIVTDTRQGTLTVPRRGLLSDAGEFFVYVAEADSVRKAAVRVGYQNEDYSEVLAGVEEGDSVVVVGAGALRTGTKIKILDPTMQQKLADKPDSDEEQTAARKPE